MLLLLPVIESVVIFFENSVYICRAFTLLVFRIYQSYLNYLGSLITNEARCAWEIKSTISVAKAELNKKGLFTDKLDLHLRKKPAKCWSFSNIQT